MWYPIDTATKAFVNSQGLYEIDFGPYNTDRQLEWITLDGPIGSSVSVYTDTIRIDKTSRGDANHADYPSGIPIASGRQLRLVWSVGIGAVPTASIGMTDGTRNVPGISGDNSRIFA